MAGLDSRSPWADENLTSLSPSGPLSGPGSSRQTRRLQLRNAGFRGAAVPTRKVTPKSNSTSASGGVVLSDAENVSPAGARTGSISVGKRQSSGVLQEIGNSGTLTRPKRARPRVASAKLFAGMSAAGYTGVESDEGPLSPPPPKTSIRPRPVKTRAKMSQKRRSVSAEMGKYIDHLETELASAQSQLSAITSPTVTREQSSRVRNLNAETKHLQQELDEWEAKYEQRVQEALDEHVAIENGLRSRIRSLEEEAEATQFQIRDLELQLESATEKTNLSETANLHLEKRLEIMSELLAASPTKIDLHAQTPGCSRKRQQRPQSMLPRFPTASSLVCSPERQPATQPASPLLSFTGHTHSPNLTFSPSPSHDRLQLDIPSPQPQASDSEHTDAESVFSDFPGTADSTTSAETLETQPAAAASFNPWSLPQARGRSARPMRRMRRFGAGSMGPKPLILPSAAGCEPFVPTSAGVLGRSETTPAFFSDDVEAGGDEIELPRLERRRASTMAGEIRVSSLENPPAFLDVPRRESVDACEAEESLLSVLTPQADRFASLGSNVGRTLMEELSRMETQSSGAEVAEDMRLTLDEELGDVSYDQADSLDEGLQPTVDDSHPAGRDERAQTASSITPSRSRRPSLTSCPTSAGTTTAPATLSLLTRLRLLFTDLYHSPVALARHLVHSAQSRMRLPSPLLNAQWWLVGILLGPMARARMLSRGPGRELLMSGRGGCDECGEEDALAYGTLHPTPPSSPRRQSSLRGQGSKRAAGKARRCVHVQHRRKHSPLVWLKFSLTLAFAVGAAFREGPGSLLKGGGCGCWERERNVRVEE